jgi:HEPN domain-containing protein
MRKLVEDWIFFADRDLKTAELIIKDDDPFTNIISFHCQQTVEKYLKAYLLENNMPLVRIHDLIKLNDMIKEIKDLNIDEKKLIILNEVYTDTRYPGDFGLMPDGLPSCEQAKEFIEFAQEVKTIILKELSPPDSEDK